jgi:hypothetical protein
MAQKVQELVGLTSARAKVNIRNEKRAVLLWFGSHVVPVRLLNIEVLIVVNYLGFWTISVT